MPDEIKVLPCPFCGGSPTSEIDEIGEWIFCIVDGCPISFHAFDGVSNWNRRAGSLDTSHNTAMPKLPSLAEVKGAVQKEMWAGNVHAGSFDFTKFIYNFICQQLSA